MTEQSTANRLRLYSRLQHAAHQVKKAADQAVVDATGLTTAQSAVLVTVYSLSSGGETVTQRRVARSLGLNESAVTAMVRKLVDSGYIQKQRSSSDGRAWEITLTNAGESVLLETRKPFGGINQALDEALGTDGVEQLASLLDQTAKLFERG